MKQLSNKVKSPKTKCIPASHYTIQYLSLVTHCEPVRAALHARADPSPMIAFSHRPPSIWASSEAST